TGILCFQGIAQEILADLVEDACLGLCFEVHRAVKQGYFFLDDTDQESTKDFEIVDQPGVDIFGQVYNQWKNKECVCPNCSRSIAASRFAPHLEKCLGMGRNSSRIANRRIASGNNTNKSESDQEDNDDVNDNDWSYGAEKKALSVFEPLVAPSCRAALPSGGALLPCRFAIWRRPLAVPLCHPAAPSCRAALPSGGALFPCRFAIRRRPLPVPLCRPAAPSCRASLPIGGALLPCRFAVRRLPLAVPLCRPAAPSCRASLPIGGALLPCRFAIRRRPLAVPLCLPAAPSCRAALPSGGALLQCRFAPRREKQIRKDGRRDRQASYIRLCFSTEFKLTQKIQIAQTQKRTPTGPPQSRSEDDSLTKLRVRPSALLGSKRLGENQESSMCVAKRRVVSTVTALTTGGPFSHYPQCHLAHLEKRMHDPFELRRPAEVASISFIVQFTQSLS
ncbi:hypothetical protein NFI96_018650, partial [Prochilodus magdalenae]